MGEGHLGAAPPEFDAYRNRTRAFSSVAGYEPQSFDLTGESEGEAKHILGYLVTASLFPTLGVQPILGRTFDAKEELLGAPKVAVLSYQFWRRQYAEDPHVIGKMMRLNERPYEIVGVMPRGFTFPSTAATPGEPPALWTPLSFTSDELNDWASSFDTSIIARLKDGVSLSQAREDVRRISDQFQQEHPNIYSGNVRLEATAELWSPDFNARTRVALFMLSIAVGFVLMIACANVANLLLARAARRQREMSIRRALGASAGRITRQVLTEASILTIAGGVAGCALAYALLRLMDTVSLKEINVAAVRIDFRVLIFTLVLCGITCLLCGIAPAWRFRVSAVHEALKQSARQSGTSRSNRHLSSSLIVTEVACCVVMLVGSGMLLRSFSRILQVPLGFDPGHTLIIRTTLNRQRYASPDRRHTLERTVEARMASLPGVSSVALTTHVPLADERQIGFVIDGRPPDEFHWADNALVGGGYFRAMRIPLLNGRTFSDADTPHSPLAAIVNGSMARQYWPNADPIGKGLNWGGRHLIVIGVVGDVHVEALDRPISPMIYNSAYQIESGATTSAVFIIRMQDGQDPRGLAASARDVIRSEDRGLPILGFDTLEQVVSASLGIRRVSLGLVTGFTLIALLLSVLGIYGVLSYAVDQRVQEMGLRFALGAKPNEIVRLVVGEGIRLAVAGILLGLAAGAIATRYIATLLFGIRSLDPVSFASAALLLLAVASLASYLPARRASRVDPMIALRYE
jgi:putative ABC transport system permease protein